MKQTYAAGAVDASKPRKITVTASLGQNNSEQDKNYVEDLRSMKVPVALYQVATVDVTGQDFTPVAPFEEMKFDISDKTTAEEWQKMAAQAMEILAAKNPGTNYSSELRGGSDSDSAATQAVFQNPDMGMYLVVAGTEFNDDNTAKFSYNADYTKKYIFTPYLTALPSSPYTTTYDSDGNPVHTDTDGNTLSDGWDYEPEIGLKIATEPLYGQLEITKELQNYNETLGQTTFTFLVEGRDPVSGELVYSDVVSTTHQALASETVTLTDIPAGVTVTVTEIYTGASYEVVGDVAKDVLIWSDEAVGQDVGGVTIQTPSVTFRNRYNGGNRGGYGVNNEFELREGVWDWASGPAEEE